MSSRMCRGNKISLTLFGASSPDYHPCRSEDSCLPQQPIISIQKDDIFHVQNFSRAGYVSKQDQKDRLNWMDPR